MSAVGTEFSLRRTVRAVLDESNETDPAALAEIALERIGDEDLRAALAETLPGYVRVQINRDNMDARMPAARTLAEASGSAGKSWKVRGIRAHGKSFRDSILKQRISVRDSAGGKTWKLYGDLDPDGLRALMADRTGAAEEILAEVERHRRVLKECERFGGVRVCDLPESALFEAWGVEQ